MNEQYNKTKRWSACVIIYEKKISSLFVIIVRSSQPHNFLFIHARSDQTTFDRVSKYVISNNSCENNKNN